MRWPAYLIANVVMLLLAYLLAPFLPAFALGRDHLPAWLSWFDTTDNPLDGDDGFKTEHAPFKGEVTGWRRYINRVVWLWRNPSYGFDINVIGFRADKRSYRHVRGKRPISGDNAIPGWYLAEVVNPDGSSAWQFFWVVHLTAAHCMRLNLGWKLWGWRYGAANTCQFVCSFTPWKAY